MTGWDDRADRFERHPLATSVRWGLGVLAVVAVLALAYIPLHFALGWFSAATKVAGPENVQAQYHGVIQDWNALEAAAGNYCAAKDAPESPNGPSLVEDPAFAYRAQYLHITVYYNTRQNNIFEAGLVGPGGYPKQAPTLDEAVRRFC